MILYADTNSGRPIYPEVADKLSFLYAQDLANPSQILSPFGKKAKLALGEAREKIADFIDCNKEEIIFTSGGTESCHLAVLGSLLGRAGGNKILSSNIEHPAVLEACRVAGALSDIKLELIKAQSDGFIRIEDFIEKTNSNTFLVNLMAANNETGICFSWEKLASELKSKQEVMFHCDMTQWIGKLPFSFKNSKIDLVSFSAHKLGGPQGVGALIIREGSKWKTPMPGGGQEQGRRGGTEPVVLIAGFGKAAELRKKNLITNSEVRDFFENQIKHKIIGKDLQRLPNTSMFIVEDVAANDLVEALAGRNIIISSGAACSKGAGSKVLECIGYSERESKSAVRVSFLHEATIEQAKELASAINEEVEKIRVRNLEEVARLYER